MKQWMGWVVALCLLAGGAMAGKADVRVLEAWTRAVPAVAPVAGGFLTVVNKGDADDRLLRVESDIAQRVELHQMRNDGGVMRMRALPEGVVVPAHGKLVLKPGGYHLMLIKPRRALVAGGHFEATLVFQRAGRVPVRFEVRAMGAGGN
ncbi:copper chaperone PCu(A)C [Thermomonas fusca]|uniref:Copper chaperone PCu(A)C n=1 Tax=Thermomonas fusca TaxID=215690 RepID=A0A5R9PI57_9GAMM|nr:copper chaperone PCu(A)C [Thermomonas fusca]TLX23082.1 copper chaperone PCu(A)C [Thermomonas fusca]